MSFTPTQAFKLLCQARYNNRLPHALLITGSVQAGSQQLALDLVQELNGGQAESLDALHHPMCRIIRPASRSRSILIQNIRDVEPLLALRADDGMHKIIIILEAERMKEEAANAFLKTLEEPPPQTLIILITEHPDHLLPTILSRCIRMDLRESQQGIQLSKIQELFLPHLREALAHLGSNVAALALRSDFQSLLLTQKEHITQQVNANVKAEAKSYSEGTGVTDWEAKQKDNTIAQIETVYLSEREELLELLTLCLGQAVLLASHAPDVKPITPEIAQIAQRVPVQELLQRMKGVDALRHDLQFNINEALALDVRLLEIIGQI